MTSPSSLYPLPSHRGPRPAPRQPQVVAATVHTLPTDPEDYAILWGTTEAGRRRLELIELKRRAALVAVTGSFILALLLLAGALG